MAFDRYLRGLVPSAAALTYNPAFKAASRVFDLLPALMFRELRSIPPNYLRIRVGVGNDVFSNQIKYLTAGKNFWFYMLANGYVTLDSTIVDIGCGCGRFAHHLRDYVCSGERFSGRYHGIDIDHEMLDWCRRHFDAERFTFTQSTHRSSVYRNDRAGDASFELPFQSASANLVFSTSLYTHLLPDELENYTREAFRVLKPGGVMAMYVFSVDHPPHSFGNRHTFVHRLGKAFVESVENPEAAVAYEEEYLLDLVRAIGFTDARVASAGQIQHPLIARKPEAVSRQRDVA